MTTILRLEIELGYESWPWPVVVMASVELMLLAKVLHDVKATVER